MLSRCTMRPAIYLDHAATTPLAPAVRAALEPFLGAEFGNPSSRHPLGVRASSALDEARRRAARAVGGRPDGVVFTSGGTEANNLAVLGFARARRRRGAHIVLGPTEHPSVRAPALSLCDEGFEVEEARLDARGDLDLEDLERRLRPDTVLVALMLVSNELGTLYPLARAARLVRARSPAAALHTDAVQAAGKVELSLSALGVDSLSVSAHKIHGPKGSGALLLAEGAEPPRPLLQGGGQERGLRSGTEHVAGCVGLGLALELAAQDAESGAQAPSAARALLARLLGEMEGVRVLAPGSARAPSILSAVLPGPPAEVWMHHLEVHGVMTSAGSACHAKEKAASPALLALGLTPDEARRVLRFSFARTTTLAEVEAAAEALGAVARELGAVAR